MSMAKDFLQRIKKLDSMIECNLAEVTRIREMLTRITPILSDDGGSGGGFHDKIGNGVAKIVDLQKRIEKDIDTYAEVKDTVLRCLKMVKNPDHVNVIYKRYFAYKTWEEIAAEMDYSYRGICYLHGRALLEFDKAMKIDAERLSEMKSHAVQVDGE